MLFCEKITKGNRDEVKRLLASCLDHFEWQNVRVTAEDVEEMSELALTVFIDDEIISLEYGMEILFLSENDCQIRLGEETFFSVTAEYVDIYTYSRETEEFNEIYCLTK